VFRSNANKDDISEGSSVLCFRVTGRKKFNFKICICTIFFSRTIKLDTAVLFARIFIFGFFIKENPQL